MKYHTLSQAGPPNAMAPPSVLVNVSNLPFCEGSPPLPHPDSHSTNVQQWVQPFIFEQYSLQVFSPNKGALSRPASEE